MSRTPFPASPMNCGLFEAFEVIVREEVSIPPVMDGEKRMEMKQEVLMGRDVPQLLDWEKSAALSPEIVKDVIVRGPVPEFVI